MLENQPTKEEILQAIRDGVKDAFAWGYSDSVYDGVKDAFAWGYSDSVYDGVKDAFPLQSCILDSIYRATENAQKER